MRGAIIREAPEIVGDMNRLREANRIIGYGVHLANLQAAWTAFATARNCKAIFTMSAENGLRRRGR
jgi:hypothetical protein